MRALRFQECLIVPFLAGAEKVTQLFLMPALRVLEGIGCCPSLVGTAAGLLCVPRVVTSMPQIRRGHCKISDEQIQGPSSGTFWEILVPGDGGQ